MCNLYGLHATADEVRDWFQSHIDWRREIMAEPGNAAAEVHPGYPGLVLTDDRLRSMAWGFPLVLKSKRTGEPLKPKPVNNARSDQLRNPYGLWRESFSTRRCLIPVSEFAEAEGEAGTKTRTWFALPGEPLFAVAGIWRDTDEWGPAYSMVMTEACVHVADVHDRMPVILRPDQWRQWTEGSADEAKVLCAPYGGDMIVRRTGEPWHRARGRSTV